MERKVSLRRYFAARYEKKYMTSDFSLFQKGLVN